MASPAEIVDQVLADLVRPDLIHVANNKFYPSLQQCHSTIRTTRDLVSVDIFPVVPNDEARVNLNINSDLPLYRDLTKVQLFQNENNGILSGEIPLCTPFKNRNSLQTEYDYYGFKIPYVYTVAGTQLQLQGVSQETEALRLTYLAWPDLVIDANTGEVSTNSWIMDEFPGFVQAQLKYNLATVIQTREVQQTAGLDIVLWRRQFTATYRGEILDA